jgi:tetratricopeptide (TPR) repeat protein
VVAKRELRSLALLVACVGAALSVASCDFMTSPEKRLERAEQMLAEGSYGAALVEIKNVLAKKPGSARAQLALARVSLQLGDPEASARALEAATSGGASKSEVAQVRAGLALSGAKYAELLKGLDDGTLPVPEPQKSVFRTQALAGLNRCVEAVELAHTLIEQQPKLVTNRVMLAECYARHRLLSRAVAELDKAVAVAPESAEAWLARGRFLQLTGKPRDAEASWQKALQYAPGKLTVVQQLMMLSQLAEMQIGREDLTAARETHQHMVQLAADGAVTQMLGARLTLLSGDYANATAELRRLVARVPELIAVKMLLVAALLADGNSEQALQLIGPLRQQSPDNGGLAGIENAVTTIGKQARNSESYWLGISGAQIVLGQLPLARAALAKAAQVAPDSPQIRAAQARFELLANHPDKAIALANDLATRDPKDLRFALLLANAYDAAGKYADAAAVLEKVMQAQPSAVSAIALFRLRTRGKLGNETAPLKDWLARNPNDLAVRAAYAEALRVGGDRAQAMSEYEKLVAAAPQNAVALNNLAWLYHLQGDARALPTAQKANQVAPGVPSVRDTYGWLLVESGATADGLKVLKSAYDEGGVWLPDVIYHYAATLSRTGDAPRARALLSRLLDEHPAFEARADAQKLLASLN